MFSFLKIRDIARSFSWKIQTQYIALLRIRATVKGYYFVGGLSIAASILLGVISDPVQFLGVIDGAILIILPYILLHYINKRKLSKGIAIFLFLHAGLTIFQTLSNKISDQPVGGTNIGLSLLLFAGSVYLLRSTFAYHSFNTTSATQK